MYRLLCNMLLLYKNCVVEFECKIIIAKAMKPRLVIKKIVINV